MLSLLLAPLLAGQTLATNPSSLLKRHHDNENNAFIPATTAGCPNDWAFCGSSGVCYNPDEGQTCCPGGTYACPSSFCLLAPYCCPNNLTPESCAEKYGLAITGTTSHDSNAEETQFPPLPPPPPPPLSDSDEEEDSDSDSLYPSATLTLSSSSGSSITISSTPIPTPESSLIPWPSVTVSGTGSPSLGVDEAEPTFTGGAGGLDVRGREVWGVVAAVGALLM